MSKQTIKQVVVTLVSDDSEDYPEVQVSYNGKATKGFRLSPYGLVSNPVTGSLGIAYSSQGQEAVKYIIPVSTVDRLKGLKEGDAGIYNEVTGDFAILTQDKGFEIFSSVGLVANIEGDAEINATGICSVTAPTINLNGVVTVSALLTVANLATPGIVAAADFSASGSPGVSGSFTTTDLKTVTVTKGIITSIV